ncbi:MAG TPA: glycosyltransferase family 39 protein [Coleofasciculaceae cyanobacterium]|jgi:4-amino-4-deoxy-L-arabinose transferase-like glycosyltransferase
MSKLAFTSNRSLTEAQLLLGLSVAALILWCVSLGDLPLRDWDEGYYAIVAREMYRTGNWLYPTYLGEPFLLKPPLMQWLVALSYQLGGVQELTTRLPPALLSACGVPLLYLIGKEVFGQRLPAVFTAFVYLTLLPVVRHGRLAMLDGMAISFFLLLLLCLLKSRKDRRWAIGIGIGLGLIALTKGMLVLLLGAIAFGFLLADRQLALLGSPYFWIGILSGNVPVLAWYAAQWQHYGGNFLQVHFQAQGLERISTSVEGHAGPPWYYLLELLKYTWPWLLFCPGGVYLAWQQRYTRWGSLVLIGTVGYLGTISLMGTKLPWYIMPVYPFFALAVAAYTSQLWQNSKRYPRIFVVILGVLAVAGLGGCVYFVLADPQPVLIVMGVIVAVTMGLAAWRVKQNNPTFIPILFVGMYLTLGLLMTSKSWIWELNEAFPVKPVAALIREQTEAGTVIHTSFAYGRPSLDFYSDRRVIPADAAALQKLWATQPYLLLDQPTLAILQLPDSVSLGTAEGFTLIAPKTKIRPSIK